MNAGNQNDREQSKLTMQEKNCVSKRQSPARSFILSSVNE